MPTFIEEPFATNSSTISAVIPEYVPAESQKEMVVVPEVFQTQAIAEPVVVEDTSTKEEAEAKAKKSEWLRMYFLGYI